MPRSADYIPKLRRHKHTGQAVVTLSGRDHYLGVWPAEKRKPPAEALSAYHRLTGEWQLRGRTLALDDETITVGELIVAFWRHAECHYRHADGTPTGELDNFKYALKPLRHLYGDTPAQNFGPLALKLVRAEMIKLGWCRNSVNAHAARVRRLFRWGGVGRADPGRIARRSGDCRRLAGRAVRRQGNGAR